MNKTNLTLDESFYEDFIGSLPYKPYCSNELGLTQIRNRENAIKHRYLQVNQPTKIIYLAFDIDRAGGVLAWQDANLPAPLWTAKNTHNAHAHIVYRLNIPVCTSDFAKLKPLQYLAAIQSAMIEKLGADKAYAGLLTKNPLHDHWQVTHWTNYQYPLDELADYLDLKGHPKKHESKLVALGRNVELFEITRQWAYKAIRDYWQPNFKDAWFTAVLEYVEAHNAQFVEPLTFAEVKGIAKSIAKWTYKNFTPKGFSDSQAVKGSKGGKAGSTDNKAMSGSIGGKASKRATNSGKSKADLLPVVLKMKEQGYSQRAISEDLNISLGTVNNWLKN